MTNLLAIAYLVFLEGILSIDNALALAALVRSRLPNEADRKKALRYGIIGAYVFRTIIIFAGVWLMRHDSVRWAAACYLVYLGAKELFFKRPHPDSDESGRGVQTVSPLWKTIIAVELMDIMFSVDSIAVALSVSQVAWVLMSGAVLGILAMRVAAQGFINLIEKFPLLEKTAFVLVLLAGFKIMAELSGVHIPDAAFMGGMFAIMGASVGISACVQRAE